MKLTLKAHKGFLTILALNFITLVATMINPLLLEKLAFSVNAPISTSLITHFFTHAGWDHFFGNFFTTFPFALYLERRVGTAKFVYTWLASGLGALALFLLTPALYPVLGCLGASGACFGIITAACMLVDGHWLFKGLGWCVLASMVLPQYQMTVASFLIPSGVAVSAHFGGFLTGLILSGTYLKRA